ncbi:DoxX family protein [Rhizosphaericola mali]|uniref:DoxX family membrane protein n=1 Tax=Rhizosphaericola mali TaxID=2545455 RepID=A0A5P2FYX1_9BACT|nr:MauE/DoxX family redox-associated membrane protein [Rhizosphaericola mali]QES88744.1 DoxX family membrane protein [Rhizosphaericola mali]
MKREIILYIIRVLLLILFLYAGVEKVFRMDSFYRDMSNQPIVKSLVPIVTYMIPLGEIIAAGLLVFDRTKKAGLYISCLLMSVFMGYVALIVAGKFPRKPCSCGELISKLSWTEHLLFNLFFWLLAIVGIYLTMAVGKHKDKPTEGEMVRISRV